MTFHLHRQAIIGAAWAAAICLFTSCIFGGDGTETGNALSGQILMENGQPAVGARVSVYPANFNPVSDQPLSSSLHITTDGEGRYSFRGLPRGEYNIQCQHDASQSRLLILGIQLAAVKAEAPNGTLSPPGSLSIPLPDSADLRNGYIYLLGVSYFARTDSAAHRAGRVTLDSVPSGKTPPIFYGIKGVSNAQVMLAREQLVKERQLTTVPPFSIWPYSGKVILNTSATGVAIGKDLFDFPLLVRLTKSNFDFSQAQPNGQDLRFAKEDGKPVPFEIESWNAAQGLAEIWVKADTIRAGDAGQYLKMHWGNFQAAAAPSRKVFDTAAGFAGVWHLGEEQADTVAQELYRDATQGGSHGDDRVTSRDQDGAIARGHGFNTLDYIETKKASSGLRLTNRFSLFAWFRAGGSGADGGELVSVGDNYGLRLTPQGFIHVFYWPPIEPDTGYRWYQHDSKGTNFLDGNWHQAVGIFDGATLRVTVDGKDLGSTAVAQTVDYKFPMNASMGRHGNLQTNFNYEGGLDEVQIHSVVRDADWIKLSYENQRPGGGMPVLGPP